MLVVDDSAFNRRTIAQMLSGESDIEVIGAATDGMDAASKTLRLAPDVITLDLEMPTMDGYAFLRWLMKERPTPVLVISSHADSRSALLALELGAVDFLAKPEARISKSIEMIRDELLVKMRAIPHLEMAKVQKMVGLLARGRPASAPRKGEGSVGKKAAIEVVAIGASTGGPPAVQAILAALPADFCAGIVVSQHMPQGFTRSFAERLNKVTSLAVSEAAKGDRLRPGVVLVAPGDHHLLVRRDREGLFAEPVPRGPRDRYAPSVDQMMASAAEACGATALGIVLTGMGNDGAAGVTAIRKRNGRCLAESEETAVIFGMPREAIRTGAVEKTLPIGKMAEEILARCTRSSEGAQNAETQE